MFEVRCIVADKRLADVMRALRNLTLESPVVIAVDEIASGQLESLPGERRKRQKGSAVAAIKQYIVDNNVKSLRASEIKDLVEACGFSPRSYSYAITQLINQKVLRKSNREKSTYEVI